jgi:3',5'-cyclic AMP phosphodiesterase CpdA
VAATLAHVSDLHIGLDADTDARAASVVERLLAADVDRVLLSGDVTHRGRRVELARFDRLFEPLRSRLVVVPGNHDRLGDDVAGALMAGPRVQVERGPGLLVVRLDSTAAHNRHWASSHGELTARDIEDVVAAVEAAPAGAVVAVLLHHHLLPLPEDHLFEQLASFLGWPNAEELALGAALLDRLLGRCDLVLHGHRHHAGAVVLAGANGRTLRVLNAGSTPRLGRVRVLTHDAGQVLDARWLETSRVPAGPERAADGPSRFRRAKLA